VICAIRTLDVRWHFECMTTIERGSLLNSARRENRGRGSRQNKATRFFFFTVMDLTDAEVEKFWPEFRKLANGSGNSPLLQERLAA
jgi:hypothetical protein